MKKFTLIIIIRFYSESDSLGSAAFGQIALVTGTSQISFIK